MSSEKPSKSDFIRGFAADVPASDVVAKAKAANIDISPAFVYAIRSKTRSGKSKPRGKPGPKPRARATKVATRRRPLPLSVAPDGTEPAFRRIAFDLGIARSREILDELEERLRDIVENGL